jgi:hypothetical protein
MLNPDHETNQYAKIIANVYRQLADEWESTDIRLRFLNELRQRADKLDPQ